jgi:hypothetical protein
VRRPTQGLVSAGQRARRNLRRRVSRKCQPE